MLAALRNDLFDVPIRQQIGLFSLPPQIELEFCSQPVGTLTASLAVEDGRLSKALPLYHSGKATPNVGLEVDRLHLNLTHL